MPARERRPLLASASGAGRAGNPLALQRPSPRRYIRLVGILVFACILYIAFFHKSPKDPSTPSPPEPVKGQFVRRIVAVGDLHGDYENALKVLHMADVVDANGSWTGNVDYFVQTGDIIDRGLDTIKIFTWIEKLREQARHAGGELFSHLGNHEMMNVLSDWRYVPELEIASFGGVAERQAALSTGSIGAAWAHNYTIASRVPLHPSSGSPFADYTPASSPNALSHASLSFMHGGLSPTFSNAVPYPSKINSLGSSLLHRCQTRKPQPPPHPPAPYAGLPPGSTGSEAELYSEDGPLWYRGWATDDEKTVCSNVDAVIKKIGVRRFIMGHTPNFQNMVSRCGGKIVIIDTGISRAYGGVLSALSITYTLTPVLSSSNVSDSLQGAHQTSQGSDSPASDADSHPDAEHEVQNEKKGKGTTQWIEREELVAIYPEKKVQLVVDERRVEGDFW